MAQMSPDHGAGNFRSESPPARISDNGEHDVTMLGQTGHAPATTGSGVQLGGHARNWFGGPAMPGIGPGSYRVMPDNDTDRGF